MTRNEIEEIIRVRVNRTPGDIMKILHFIHDNVGNCWQV